MTNIGNYAFQECSALTSVTIPNSVTSIGYAAFAGCSRLTSVTIPNSVTSIGDSAFSGCSGLTSVTIPNSVTRIGVNAFSGCSALTSVTIPNSVTAIWSGAFQRCSALTSVTIPNSVTSIGKEAFSNCSALTSINIPNSVTSIGKGAFMNCSSLTSVTIPNSVTRIGDNAFYCDNLTTVKSYIETPFAINGKSSSSRVFHLDTFNNATLYVPAGTIEKYKATDGWKDFVFIEEGSGGVTPPPTPQKCATPTIAYNKGTLEFSCETEGVEYVGEVNTHKQQQINDATLTIQEPVTTITVFAKKDGYTSSDTATATISWQNGQPVFEGFSNVTIDSVYDLNGDGKISTADIQVIINEMKK